MSKIRFSPESVNDLREIKAYIEDELLSESAANNTISKIMKRINIFEQFPNSAPSLSSVVGYETDYRYLVCGNYNVFYRVDDNDVYIVRVLYGRRDYMRVLFAKPKIKK